MSHVAQFTSNYTTSSKSMILYHNGQHCHCYYNCHHHPLNYLYQANKTNIIFITNKVNNFLRNRECKRSWYYDYPVSYIYYHEQ